jgi:hypothetical protein
MRAVVVLGTLMSGALPGAWAAGMSPDPPTCGASPDTLYADRARLDSARAAADAWRGALADHRSAFESAWKLSRADYYLGGHVASDSQKQAVFSEGMEAGRQAIAAAPDRPEGHFWIAANMGGLAESSMRNGLKYRRSIKDELDWVLRRAPAFEEGSADRALGRWYARVPALFGGSQTQAEAHLRASLAYNPRNTASHYFLAELFLDEHRTADARAELQQVLDAPLDPELTPEDLDFKARATDLLDRTTRRDR